MKKTLKQRNLETLQAAGWSEDTAKRLVRYTTMTKPGCDYHYFLGRAGAVRRGRNITTSVSVKLKANELVKRSAAQQPKMPRTLPRVGQPPLVMGSDPQGPGDGSNEQEDEQRPDPTSDKTNGAASSATPATASVPNASSDSFPPLQAQSYTVVVPKTSPLAVLLKRSLDRELPKVVAGYTPTEEQVEVLKAATAPGLRCLVLPAGAGAGKTSTLKMLEEVLPGKGQYTAFNRSLVAESKSKFKKARCSTTHSLAFGAVGKTFSHRLNGARMRSEQIASRLGISDLEIAAGVGPDGQPALRKLVAGFLAGQVMTAVRRFCQSADERIAGEHFKRIDGIDESQRWENNEVVRRYLLPFAEKAWADLASTDGGLPFSHDVYVKLWQLGKGPSKPVIPADYILLDEAQDTAPVFLDVLKQQAHALLIFVGDSNQAIYEWRGAVDAMRAFPDAPRRQLSQSFRFGQRIADVANSILAGLEEPTDLLLKGLGTLASAVSVDDPIADPKCVLTRTNAGAIGTMLEAHGRGKTVHLIAAVDEVIAFVKAAQSLQDGRPVSHPDLGCFGKWSEVVEYSKTDEGQELRLWVRLIDEFGCRTILQALEAQVPEDEADLVICTAHKSKGREWRSVRLAGDFPPACRMSDPDVRLLYVAATRAKMVLDLSACPPFHPYVSKETGEETPGIKIKWTGDMPELDAAMAVKEEAKAPTEATPRPSPSDNGKAKEEFSWANYNGKWCVGGPPGRAGETVEVTRKNGSKSRERLGTAIKQFPERSIYELR